MDDRRELRKSGEGVRRRAGWPRRHRAVLLALAACEPSAPPGFNATPAATATGPPCSASASEAPRGSAPVAAQPAAHGRRHDGPIVGLGNGVSPDFDLPAGNANMTVSVCKSNQVILFVTFFRCRRDEARDHRRPRIRDQGFAGGKYRFEVASNPDCVWTIEVTPA
jgi:hypothetical protein